MIKLTFCLVRLPHLSREEFQSYWYDQHGPLVASVKEALKIRRYVQTHSLPVEVADSLRTTRDAPAGYDGVAQLWWLARKHHGAGKYGHLYYPSF